MTNEPEVRDEGEAARHARELRAAREAAESAARAQTEFLANVSHEIRTPVNVIAGVAELLGEMNPAPEQRNLLEILRRSSQMLLEQVTNVLDYAKTMNGDLDLEEIPFDLHALVEETAKLLALRAHEKRLELVSRIAPDVPARVIGDPTRLRQVLVNLVGNAIKFTASGEVVLEVTTEPASGDGPRLGFCVRDTGIGVPPDRLEQIFEPFFQVDGSMTRKYGGSGLGLSICKRLVERMGGRIWAENNPTAGSSFFLRLGFGAAAQPMAHAGPVLEGRRVLVVDDTEANRLVLKDEIGAMGATVVEVEDASRALVALRRSRESGTSFDLVFLDCRMPGMGGFEFAERLAGQIGTLERVIMMLPADHRAGDVAHARTLGMAGVLYKPICRSAVRDAIGSSGLRGDTSDAGAPRILLADDDEDTRALVHFFLRGRPYVIDEAANGRLAVEMAQASEYDLVLMDLQMPLLDGYEAIETIRRWEKANERRPVPIVIFAPPTFGSPSAREILRGADAAVTKPLERARLVEVVEESLEGAARTGEAAEHAA